MPLDPVMILGEPGDGLHLLSMEAAGDGDAVATMRLVQEGLSATFAVREFSVRGGTFPALQAFVKGMAKDWRGWRGERQYESIEGELAVSATHDGHVRLQVEVRRVDQPLWRVAAEIVVDPGEALAQASRDLATAVETARRR